MKRQAKKQMKRLTINHIAAAGIRTNRRAYVSLAIGIFLSIFLITTICLCVQGVLLIQQEKLEQRLGRQDGFFMDSILTDTQVRDCGLFDQLGHVYVSAQIAGTDEYLGYYDSDAEWLLNRTLKEGRLPQQPGEIAVEQSVLEITRSEAGAGEYITLTITPVDGVTEQRTFLIVGILNEQSDSLKPRDIRGTWDKERVYSFPSVLISPKEAPLQTGRTAVHQLVTVKIGYDTNDAINYWCDDRQNYPFFVVMADGEVTAYRIEKFITTHETYLMLIMVGMVGLAFITACGIGIAQAMEGQLSRKVEQIGMLRAVGATRRQIRKIFGREAWVLALILSPLSVAGGCLFVKGIEWLFPEVIRFKASLSVLLPIILFSVICIFISAYFPLRKASRIMPMQAMRDTTMLRRIKSVRSKKKFSVPKLISSRQFRIHPTRQLGAAVLVALMIYCSGMGVYTLYSVGISIFAGRAEFELYNDSYSRFNSFIDLTSPRTLTAQDIHQIRAIPHVDHVVVESPIKVNALIDEKTPYFEELGYYVYMGTNDHLYGSSTKALEVMQDMFDVEKIPLEMMVNVAVIDSAKAFEQYVVNGDIDIAALDSGREVLVCAPRIYIEVGEDGGSWRYRQMERGQTYIEDSAHIVIENDYFTAGQALPLIYISKTSEYPDYDDYGNDTDYYEALYTDAKRQDALVTIGAVLDNMPSDWEMFGDDKEPCIITTQKGLQALGMETDNWQSISVYLDGEVDLETEAQIDERINTIAMRGTRIRTHNNLALDRSDRESSVQMVIALLSVVVTFFAVSVSIISGAIRRRIRADMRMIGTLRAVGADEHVISKCYSGHISISILLGLIVSVLLYFKSLEGVYTKPSGWLAAAVMGAFALACFVCCRIAMKMSLHDVMKKSVVENIREL